MTRYTARDSHGKAYFAGCVQEVLEQIAGQRDRRSEWIDEIADKLAEYEDAEEQGRLIKLPCKVGDRVFVVERDEVKAYTVNHFTIIKNGVYAYLVISYSEKSIVGVDDFGKTVFLTREEAEAEKKARSL